MASEDSHAGIAAPRPVQGPLSTDGTTGSIPAIWSVAGGKGGVGRSLMAANLAIHLSRAGRRIILLDLDLQGGNLHNYLGFTRLPHSLGDFASGAAHRLGDLLLETASKRLRLIGGLQRGDLRYDPVAFVRRVVAQLSGLPADIVIIDCGSGRSPEAIAGFGSAELGILVTTPEPTAVESTCLFTEAHLRARFAEALQPDERAPIDSRLKEEGLDPDRAPFRLLLSRIGAHDPKAGRTIGERVRQTRIELLLNQAQGEGDEEAVTSILTGFRKCFGLKIGIAGVIEHDPAVLKSIQKRRALSKQFPNTTSTKEIARAANRLLAVSGRPFDEADTEWEELGRVDCYRVLEIPPRASSKEVQAAYQRLRRAYDPETTHLSPLLDVPALRATLARIEDSYRTLIFLESREEYDRQLSQHRPEGGEEANLEHGRPQPPPLELAGSGTFSPHPAPSDAVESATGSSLAGDGSPVAAPVSMPEAAPAGPEPGPVERRPLPATGTELREERERQNQTLDTIAERTKIRPAHLRAIEEERFADLPAAVYVRGFLKEYGACLGFPGEEISRLYMERFRAWQASGHDTPVN